MIARVALLAHLVSTVVFLGTFIAAWLAYVRAVQALRANDAASLAAHVGLINVADRWLTPPASALLIISGAYMAVHQGLSITGTGWIVWSLMALGLSGIVFVARLRGLQHRLEAEALRPAPDWAASRRMLAAWALWSSVGTAAAAAALCFMVLRPDLPGF